ncbi:hypothetical protein FHT77_001801 [Rhizobium sp. BK181]|uniref:hypothetical protein n=1 Tax=Rhizobium sp. BK181 TaxID=2587072 RepID=UPI001622E863|nr:hypothetical protein [Rhizobium sp. BK181]MBB3315936.1 hypothetical protein [Rhizobium sp. BK181]
MARKFRNSIERHVHNGRVELVAVEGKILVPDQPSHVGEVVGSEPMAATCDIELSESVVDDITDGTSGKPLASAS